MAYTFPISNTINPAFLFFAEVFPTTGSPTHEFHFSFRSFYWVSVKYKHGQEHGGVPF